VALAPKTFDLLLLLASNAGRTVSKQELMSALWPDTFVEDTNLSFQVSTLRRALGEAGAEWIEAVPKHGYRFAAVVAVNPPPATLPGSPTAALAGPALATAVRTSTGWRRSTRVIVGLIVIGAGYFAFVSLQSTEPPNAFNAVATPLTGYPGNETGPSLNPDGTQVAFSWNGPHEDNPDIYVKLAGMGEPIPLTKGPERDESPAWSPDGQRIAFVRRIPERTIEVFVIPALGGAERRVASFLLDSSRRSTRLSWSPDGKWIAIGGKRSSSSAFGLWLVEIDGPDVRPLTTPPAAEWFADFGPAFSPDGRRIAFIRTKATSSAIFVLPLSSALAPISEPVLALRDPRRSIVGLSWTPDGRNLVYSTGGHVGPTRLEQLALTADSKPEGQPQILPFGDRATQLSIARTGRVVYSTLLRDANFWKLDLRRPDSVLVDAGLSTSTYDETAPSYSPDGAQLVFTSTRRGSEELFISNVDGSGVRQVTSMGGPQCDGARWAPVEGGPILFTSTSEGTTDLYLLDPRTTEVRRLTVDPADEIEANWSRNGKAIYFGSNRTGRFEIWRVQSDGTGATQVTRNGGQTAQESFDGRALYYAKNGSPTTIWRHVFDGGEDVQVADGLSYPNNFVVARDGIYFLAVGDSPMRTSIDFFEFRSGRRTTLTKVGKPWWYGITLTPDERWLLVATVDRDGSDLMLVDPFR
jgi:Tol biopolymer transport system component